MDRPPRTRASSCLGPLAAAAVLAAASTAFAGEPRDDSRAAFLRGVAEAHQDNYAAARDAFLDAYRLFPHPSILLNLGVARLHTGEFVAAESDLEAFLAGDGGATREDLANARAALEEVRRHLGTVRVRVTPRGARTTLGRVLVSLRPGSYTDVRAPLGPTELRVDAEGYAPVTRELVVSADAVVPVDIILLSPSLAASSPTSDATTSAPHGEEPKLLGWGLLGTATVAALVGGVAGFEAIGFAHDYNTPGSAHYQDRGTRDEGVAWRTSADVLFASAIVIGVVGAYVLLHPTSHAPPARGPAPAWLVPADGTLLRF